MVMLLLNFQTVKLKITNYINNEYYTQKKIQVLYYDINVTVPTFFLICNVRVHASIKTKFLCCKST